MRRMVVAAAVVMVAVGMAWGMYAVSYRGDWPKSWPKKLDELREQATTMVGPTVEQRHYLIPFKSRERFELAVDGKIVDLNRIELPGDTPIIDERFQKQK